MAAFMQSSRQLDERGIKEEPGAHDPPPPSAGFISSWNWSLRGCLPQSRTSQPQWTPDVYQCPQLATFWSHSSTRECVYRYQIFEIVNRHTWHNRLLIMRLLIAFNIVLWSYYILAPRRSCIYTCTCNCDHCEHTTWSKVYNYGTASSGHLKTAK